MSAALWLISFIVSGNLAVRYVWQNGVSAASPNGARKASGQLSIHPLRLFSYFCRSASDAHKSSGVHRSDTSSEAAFFPSCL